MTNQRPLFLLSNDDGYFARGLNKLIDFLRPIGDVLAVAPATQRSGASCSMTVTQPVTLKPIREEEDVRLYSCTGTPTDCVKLAFHTLLDRRPDMVIGGINHGDNSAVNVHYSGTMGVVLEGCLKGIPSVGFSMRDHSLNADFDFTAPYIERIVRQTLLHGLPQGVCLNVNFPAAGPCKGVRVCRMAHGDWVHEWQTATHPRGYHYYWLTGEFALDDDDPDADYRAMADGYVVITPTKIDITDYEMIQTLKSWDLSL